MKKIVRALSVAVAPIVTVITFLSGCFFNFNSKPVEIENGEIMQDINEKPQEDAAYAEYSAKALQDYRAVAAAHRNAEGEVDVENAEVIGAANVAAAKLFAYACYNERTLDKYVYFSDQEGNTDLGGSGSAEARRQEYYLRVNESEKTCGYRYHYTIKKVTKSSGGISAMKGFFESARLRFTDKTDLLYRFEGENSTIALEEKKHEVLGCQLLKCNWGTGKDWGEHDIVMRKSDYIPPEQIEEDIVRQAGEENITIRGNINILAENIIKSSVITEDEDGGVSVIMFIDTDVANTDEASLKMLRKANGSDDCRWTDKEGDSGLTFVCRYWPNGLFRFYSVSERWSGKIKGFSGAADSVTSYHYSYSDRDCDMTANLQMLEQAKKDKG